VGSSVQNFADCPSQSVHLAQYIQLTQHRTLRYFWIHYLLIHLLISSMGMESINCGSRSCAFCSLSIQWSSCDFPIYIVLLQSSAMSKFGTLAAEAMRAKQSKAIITGSRMGLIPSIGSSRSSTSPRKDNPAPRDAPLRRCRPTARSARGRAARRSSRRRWSRAAGAPGRACAGLMANG
jgi:hypothetical protein